MITDMYKKVPFSDNLKNILLNIIFLYPLPFYQIYEEDLYRAPLRHLLGLMGIDSHSPHPLHLPETTHCHH